MKYGYLSKYFSGVATKELTAVEVCENSNQHEFQGVAGLRDILGCSREKKTFRATFIFFHDEENPVFETGYMTWSDVRRNNPDRSPEYHLYYSSSLLPEYAKAGDRLFLAQRNDDDSLLAIVARPDSTITQQLFWLFAIESASGFVTKKISEEQKTALHLSSTFILESIGITVELADIPSLEELLARFSDSFPSTKEFSAFTRSTLPDVVPTENHDLVLMTWLEREELLFRALEKHLINVRLKAGFETVEDFISFSLSVQNRRKSRAGLSLENHLETLFKANKIQYSRNPVTENKSRPDFIFPDAASYHDNEFSPLLLTMLGVKTTCKDRWRQVLAEADRIENKHLLTIEAAISKNQTDEMKAKNLQLVLPASIHSTYTAEQQKWLMSVSNFTSLLRSRQKSIR